MTAPASGPSSFPQDPPPREGGPGWEEEQEQQGPVVRDKRRLDPETGQVRAQPGTAAADAPPGGPSPAEAAAGYATAGARPQHAAPSGSGPGEGASGDGAADGTGAPAGSGAAEDVAPSPEAAALQQQLDERTEDLRRVTAEYANYRRRVERDRTAVVEAATGGVLAALLPVLDDLDRARQHGDLQGAFATVGEALEKTVASLGLERFGEPGEPFDPNVHEALTHGLSPDVTETTAVQVFQPGYRLGERVLRPARVAVADPGEPEQQDPAG